jgi:hypothetical protein
LEYSYAPVSFTNIWQNNQKRAELTMTTTLGMKTNMLFHTNGRYNSKNRLYTLYPKKWNNLGTIKLQHNRTTFKTALKEQLVGALE